MLRPMPPHHASPPTFIQPQLSLLVKTPPTGPGWAHELKYYSDLPEVTAVNGREIYRSRSSIGGLHEGNYVLNLTRVTLPHQAPPDMPHHRSGAALHVVLSGFGAETADGTTVVPAENYVRAY
jgi:hypothetical protein